ncbi:endocuticle structural glycoprotein SgAbd-2-like [Bacillus rossius redtenbacheri]|uniref:endocuticle structural glycoprotein SgAbd-2-like n=1 Tax=Bacillus rossius redtenbacheri TaxID=93214 RepID=UPI002FDDE5F2
MNALVVLMAVLAAAAARPQFAAYTPLGLRPVLATARPPVLLDRPVIVPRPVAPVAPKPVVPVARPVPVVPVEPLRRLSPDQPILILKQAQDQGIDGSYSYSFDTENGITAQEVGTLANVGAKEPVIIADGYYRYTSPEGIPIEVKYVANENGFVAQGAHLPTPPPIPEAILRSLEFIAANPPAPERSSRT